MGVLRGGGGYERGWRGECGRRGRLMQRRVKIYIYIYLSISLSIYIRSKIMLCVVLSTRLCGLETLIWIEQVVD